MTFKTAEEELDEFLATLPAFVRKHLSGELFDVADTQEYLASDPSLIAASIAARFDELLRRVPRRRRQVERKILQRNKALSGIAPADMGRPRLDHKASEAQRLKTAGKSYGQIAKQLGGTSDSIRKLIKSRQRRPPGEKSH